MHEKGIFIPADRVTTGRYESGKLGYMPLRMRGGRQGATAPPCAGVRITGQLDCVTATPHTTYDRLSEIDQGAIVDNKRLGHVLQLA